jgi:hypothetical protein
MRGAHGASAVTNGAGTTLAADNLDTGLACVQVVDMTLPVAFGAGLLGAGPRQAGLPQRHGCRRCIDRYRSIGTGPRPGIVHYTHLTLPVRVGARRNHTGKNPLALWRGRPLIAVAGRMAPSFSIGTLSLHVAQYAPCERVARKPRDTAPQLDHGFHHRRAAAPSAFDYHVPPPTVFQHGRH